MKILRSVLIGAALWTNAIAMCGAQSAPRVESATRALIDLFRSHDVVLLGEMHGNKQEYDWLRAVVADQEFADTVDDIVMEFGNSLYQNDVDLYERGEDVPLDQVQAAWRDTVASVGPPSPVYESLYKAVREANLKRKGKHQIRILCGDPAIDWKQVAEGKDIVPFLSTREQTYAGVMEREVIARHRRALLIMGTSHFLRHFDPMPSRKQFDIESQLRTAGANPYLIIMGTNTIGKPGEVDHRFDAWPVALIIPLAGDWVGQLPAVPVVTEGRGPPSYPLKLEDAADALQYFGPPESLTALSMPESDLAGTSYATELERRRKLQMSLEK